MSPRVVKSLLACGFLQALASCSSSSGSGADAGSEANYGYGSDDASEAGDVMEGGEAGEAAPVCKIPASATSTTMTEAGPIGCTPHDLFNCDATSYGLVCVAPDPNTGVPQPDMALMCALTTNTDPAKMNYCCPCGK